tara:strand:- start:942 stop:1985 length:1044 start_codon:yes stop_codon:yes gene_type:complete
MGLDDLAGSLNIMGGQSSVFGNATKGDKIVYLARVVDNEDRSNMGRIKATIIDFNDVNGEEQPGKDKNDNIPKFAFPLIYQFVNVIPRVGELVYIFLENPKDQSSRRFYIGPIRSVKKAQKQFESTSSANSLFNINSYSKVETPNQPINEKTAPINDHIRINGKNNSNITFKPREVLITAGELQNNSFDLNLDTQCFIQMKDHLAIIETELAKSVGSFQAQDKTTIKRPAFSQTNVVGTNVNLISSSKSSGQNRALDENGKLVDQSNVENTTNPELEIYGETAKKLHPLVLGDELVKVLKIIIRFCLNHKHTPQEKPYATGEEIDLLTEFLADENIQFILSKSVRTN